MSGGSLAFAFTAGMVSTVNPCGFALLPAYLGYFLGLDETDRQAAAAAAAVGPAPSDGGRGSHGDATRATVAPQPNPVLRALAVSGAVTLGFVAVFGVMGVVWSSVSGWLGTRLPYVTMVLGAAIAVLGIAMLRGFEPVVNLPHLQLTRRGRELSSMFLYGVSYAIASLSCTIGVFIAVTSTTLASAGFLDSLASFLAYGLGMGATLAVLTLAVALARQGVVARFRRLMPHIHAISGVLLILAGLFVAYYAWVEVQELNGGESGRVVTLARDAQSAMQRWLQDRGAGRLALAAAIVIGGAVGVSLLLRGRRAGTGRSDEPARPAEEESRRGPGGGDPRTVE